MDILATAAAGAQAVDPAIREQLLDPFIEATTMTLAEMANMEVTVAGVFHKPDSFLLGEVNGLMPMVGTDRTMVLSFPPATAQAVAGRILVGAAMKPDDDLVRDCLGEVTNVVAGQAKALVSGTHYKFTLSTPQVVHGTGHGSTLGASSFVIVFQSEIGDFALQLFPAA